MLVQEQKLNSYRQQPNAGQVARLKLLPVEDVLDIVPPGQGPPVSNPFTISRYGLAVVAGTTLTELVFPAGGCTFQENSATEASGKVWSTELQLTIPKNQASLLDWIDRHQGRRWLAMWLDRNGLAYLAGEPGNGLRMEASREIVAGNSVSVSLKSRYSHPTWFLETFDTATLFADVDFDLSFDFSFNA